MGATPLILSRPRSTGVPGQHQTQDWTTRPGLALAFNLKRSNVLQTDDLHQSLDGISLAFCDMASRSPQILGHATLVSRVLYELHAGHLCPSTWNRTLEVALQSLHRIHTMCFW